MSQFKREFMPLYSYYDRSGMARHLEEMAAKGWMLEKLGAWSWRYRRTEPQKLRFSITYFPTASQFDPGPGEGLETLRDYCAQAGWTLAADNAQVQVFYSGDENAVPIETDPGAEFANIRRAMKRSFLPNMVSLLLLSLLELGFLFWQFLNDPVKKLSSPTSFYSALGWLPLFLLVSTELFRYFRWQKRAGAAVEAGAPLPELRSSRTLSALVLAATGLMLFLELFAAFRLSPRMLFVMLGSLLYVLLLIVLANAAKSVMRRRGVRARTNRLVTFALIVALSIAMPVGMTALILHNSWSFRENAAETYEYKGMTWSVYHDPIPLEIADLTDTGYTQWSTTADENVTFLLAFRTYNQCPRMDALDQPDLAYDIVEVRCPALYGLCEKAMLERYWYDHEPAYRDTYYPVDAAPWGAEKVYQMCFMNETPSNRYLLCWPDRIVELRLDWEPTPEQMAKAGDLLKTA